MESLYILGSCASVVALVITLCVFFYKKGQNEKFEKVFSAGHQKGHDEGFKQGKQFAFEKCKAEFKKQKIEVVIEEKGYFIGIDVGRNKIESSLIDYSKFIVKDYQHARLYHSTQETPENIGDVFHLLKTTIQKLSQRAPQIDGIGIGLPGQVDPTDSVLLNSPGFEEKNIPFGKRVQDILTDTKFSNIPIKIDNDVRCATRYLWKRNGYNDIICVFSGIGLGSGIVLDGKMLYGHNFTAGEIGHTTISEECEHLGLQNCMCDKKGYHWEMFVTRSGLMNIVKRNHGRYQSLKDNYYKIINRPEYVELLKESEFEKNKKKHSKFIDGRQELTTYFIALAFYAGDEYVNESVKLFLKYLAIGVANYLNVINPHQVYLGGGMMRGFFSKTRKNKAEETTYDIFTKELKNYALDSATKKVEILQPDQELGIASMGAALIFNDESHLEFIKLKEIEKKIEND